MATLSKITRRALQREAWACSVGIVSRHRYRSRRRRRESGLLRRLRGRDQAAFWHFSPQRLVVAVLARSSDEPLLLSCATVVLQSQVPTAPFAAGLIEAARAASALATDNVVALDEHYCRLVPADEAVTDSVPVLGCTGLVAQTPTATITALVDLFEDARLRLVALDSAECARISLRQFLGSDGSGSAQSALADPLAAISVLPECEAAATELAPLLAVPVGAALGWYGLVDHGDG